MNKYKTQVGFSIIETILVIALILAFGGITVFLLLSSQVKERDAERKFALVQVQLALELYADANDKRYPEHADKSPAENYLALEQDLVPRYMKALPKDPLNNKPYVFEYVSKSGEVSSYELNAKLERDGDQADRDTNDGGNEEKIYEVGTDLTLIKSTNH